MKKIIILTVFPTLTRLEYGQNTDTASPHCE